MKRKRLFSFLVVGLGIFLIVGILVGVKGLQIAALIEAGESMPEPEETVAAHTVEVRSIEQTLTALGTVSPVFGVDIAADAPGVVRQIAFRSGQTVREGDLLVQLDVAVEKAELASAEASVRLAELNLERSRDLYGKEAVPRAELDAAEANQLQARARVEAMQATIDRKTIRAPFDGKLGVRQVQLGQFLNSGAAVVSLQAMESVYVDFTLPQQRLSLLNTGMLIRVRSDASPEKVFEGELTTIEPAVDGRTRSVRLQASFENPDLLLRPGMFVQVEVVLPQEENVKLIPATSVLAAPYGDSVFVVQEREDGAQIVRQRFVRRGRSVGDYVVIEEGVEEGDLVVSDGAFKLRNDLKVRIDNAKAAQPSFDPQPDEA